MVSHADNKVSDLRRKIIPTGGRIRIKEPQRLPEICQPVAGYSPVGNIVMLLRRVHVIYILQVLHSAQLGAGAIELTRLKDDVTDGVIASILAFGSPYAIHNDGCYSLHAGVAFTAGFTLYQTRKQFQITQIYHLATQYGKSEVLMLEFI